MYYRNNLSLKPNSNTYSKTFNQDTINNKEKAYNKSSRKNKKNKVKSEEHYAGCKMLKVFFLMLKVFFLMLK